MPAQFAGNARHGIGVHAGIDARVIIGMDGVGREVHHGDDAVALHFAHEGHQAILGVVAYLNHLAARLPGGERRVGMPEPGQAAVEIRERIGRVGGDRVAVEEGERMVVADLLPGIDQRQAARHDEREGGHDLAGAAHARELRAVPRILVVVGGEHQAHGGLRVTVTVGINVVAQGGHAYLLLRHVVHQVVHLPGIAGVEGTRFEEVRLLGLGQQEQVGVHLPQAAGSFIPELHGHEHRHVAAETVDGVPAHPELHGVGLGPPYVAVRVVEFGGVRPVPGHGGRPRGIALIPVGRLLADPAGVARRMVGDPVQQHLHAQAVRLGDKRIEIPHRPQPGVDGAIVADRIVRAQRALAPLGADRIDGHEPYGVDAHVAQEAELRGGGPEGTFARQLAHVHFIDYSLVAPLGMQHNLRILIRNRIPGRQMYVFFRKKSGLRPNRVKMGQNSWAGGYVYFIKNYYLCARYKTPYTKTKRSK